jgi:hypothetical protein
MATAWLISPQFLNSKLSGGRLEDKIDVFEDRMTGWFLRHADALCANSYPGHANAGIAALTIVASYFEAIECYYSGQDSRNRSAEFFRRGFLKVFPDLPGVLRERGHANPDELADELAADVYEQLRCGLLHEALPRHLLLLREDTAPVGFMIHGVTGDVGSIVVDPRRFVEAIANQFRHYIGLLRDPAQEELRRNFATFFDLRSQAKSVMLPPPVQQRA